MPVRIGSGLGSSGRFGAVLRQIPKNLPHTPRLVFGSEYKETWLTLRGVRAQRLKRTCFQQDIGWHELSNLVRDVENVIAIEINFDMIFIVIQVIQGGISTFHIGSAGVLCEVFSRR